MNKKKTWSLAILIVIILAIIAVVVWPKGQKNNTVQSKSPITIGSKNFTESKIVMQIYTDALKKAGYNVKTKPNISSSVVYQAIKSGQVDLYPEYTGTIAMTYLKKHIVGKTPAQIAAIAKEGVAGVAKENLTTLNYAPGSDAQGIAIKTSVAKKYGIKTISDLQKKANKIRFASQGEFDKREDGIPGLEKAYGKFNFKSEKIYDPSLKYKVLARGDGDITPASTTEGQLATKDFFALKDDKNFWPAYNLVPLVREKTLKDNPGIKKILNKIDAKLTTKELTLLNKKVDVDGESYQAVAKEWLKNNY
ncbi:glycine betaine ABC transporter substrate-binding protein [Lactobacillus helveticus]|uniref:glycine betaine ABC transporter substrate-binding protein n=1 Tax=Lactobacillus helveticus TaxID=1587 RepID=UPI001561FB95|nr:glycine betaine ABC transporter substrate-binding protein [Lactobacillus helveticus]NRN76841.1 Osmoprotectant-binding protein OsmX [Lactobacillus helveticus]NRO10742.1 Osmoprotectant-binding protein OsmX [Lactobacillus helveticus]NRO66764.1 Osmoprotectant-binding protein OsmX [Lactobacillus helveticus]